MILMWFNKDFDGAVSVDVPKTIWTYIELHNSWEMHINLKYKELKKS